MFNNNAYKMVVCPQCGHREAYFYLSDVDKALEKGYTTVTVACNRQNNCGFRGPVSLEDLGYQIKGIQPSEQAKRFRQQIKEEEEKRQLRRKTSAKGLNLLTRYHNKTDEFPLETYRGIKKETFERSNISYISKGFLEEIENHPNYKEIGKAFKTNTYSGRDIVFWVNDWNGDPSRVVMRSIKLKSTSDRKEASMVLPISPTRPSVPLIKTGDKKGSMLYTLWNADTIMNNPNLTHLIAFEGIYDALSVIEANEHDEFGVVSLIGVSQTRRLMQLIEAYETKYGTTLQLIIAFDNDKAGNKFAIKAKKEYRQLFMKNSVRMLPSAYEDFNAYYENEPLKMKLEYEKLVKSVKGETK